MITETQTPAIPQNLDAEWAVLGTLLRNQDAMLEVMAIISADHFSHPANAAVFRVLVFLYNQKAPVEATTLRQELRNAGVWDEIGVDGIKRMVTCVGSVTNGAYYARQIKDAAVRRQLLAAANATLADVLESPDETGELIQRAAGRVDSLALAGEDEGVDPSDQVRRTLDDTISGSRQAIDWPWQKFSRFTKALLPGTVTLLAGDPGAAKSFMLLEAAWTWYEQGIKTAVMELEEDRAYHLCRSLAQKTQMPDLFDDTWIRNNPEMVRSMFSEYREFLRGFGKTIYEIPEGEVTLQSLIEWVRIRARSGCRIIAIDPVTAAGTTTKQSWNEDRDFMMAVKSIVRDSGSSLILVTHPRKGRQQAIGLDEMAGGAAYQRFAQTVAWVEILKQPKEVFIASDMGGAPTLIITNRVMHLCKTRNGPGCGACLAFDFRNLTFRELGLIVPKPKMDDDQL